MTSGDSLVFEHSIANSDGTWDVRLTETASIKDVESVELIKAYDAPDIKIVSSNPDGVVWDYLDGCKVRIDSMELNFEPADVAQARRTLEALRTVLNSRVQFADKFEAGKQH